ncbi:rev protein [Simian immunodeficiency virus]|uniref:Rev protein n=1 Tax=Simian immunodeficiency virus TaxID=11723 RepID=O90277_SIV|nr:rev protein [Simian immunodeficiency virus]
MSTGNGDELPRYLRLSRILEPRTARQRRRERSRYRDYLHQLRAVQERIFQATVERGLERAFTRLAVSDSPEVAQGRGNTPPITSVAEPQLAVAFVDPFLPKWATPLADQQQMDGGKRSEDSELAQGEMQKEQRTVIEH